MVSYVRSRPRSRFGWLLHAFGIGIPALVCVSSATTFAFAQEPGRAFGTECLIEASAKAELGAPVAGLVKKVFVERGDVVQAGQVLAELDSGVERAMLDLARARAENDHELNSTQSRLEYLSRKTERVTKLTQVEAASEASRDETDTELKLSAQAVREAELNLHVAKLEVKRTEALLEQRIIRSPFEGVVVERALSPGAYLHDQAHVLTILQVDPLYVEVYLPLERFGSIQDGDLAIVQPDKPVGGKFAARVAVVDPFIDAASATFGVRLTLDNPDGKVPAGLRCTVTFPARIAVQLKTQGE